MIAQEVEIAKIHWQQRYREEFGDMDGMVESIKEKGIIQPITVTPDFELLAGERRVTAAKLAGLTHIPALIREKKDGIDAREIELYENIYRKDFTWVERAKLTAEIDRLYKEKDPNWSGRKTAGLLEKSQTQVVRDLKLAQHIAVIPELAELKTADEALKLINKLEEKAIIGELRKRQVEQVATGSIESGLQTMLKIADASYQIGDVFAGLAALPNGGDGQFTKFHVIECDPPYGIDLTEQKRSKESAASNVHSYQEVDSEGYPDFLRRLCNELYRVAGANTWLVFWYGWSWHQQVLETLRGAGWKVDEIPCVWVKNQGQTMQPKTNFGRATEPFFLARKGNPTILREGRLNVFNFSPVAGTKKYHPTERPVALIEEILNSLAAPRSSVLVPFLGSGATLRAAYNSGMSAKGWDLNGEYKDKFMLAVEEDTRAIGGESAEEEVAGDDSEDDGEASFTVVE